MQDYDDPVQGINNSTVTTTATYLDANAGLPTTVSNWWRPPSLDDSFLDIGYDQSWSALDAGSASGSSSWNWLSSSGYALDPQPDFFDSMRSVDLFSLAESRGTYNDFLEALGQQESGGNYGIQNPRTGAAGKYQFIESALQDVGHYLGDDTRENDFKGTWSGVDGVTR